MLFKRFAICGDHGQIQSEQKRQKEALLGRKYTNGDREFPPAVKPMDCLL